MLKFVTLPREGPKKRPASSRRADFGEIHAPLDDKAADAQASRCSQCGVPFCQSACPLGNDIPDWLRLVAEGRLQEAYEASAATNSMPEVCGKICPQDRLCEGACVIEQSGHGSVTIGAVEEYLTETAFANGWVAPVAPARPNGKSVGIIGSGPAGLSAAEILRRGGCDVVVYDRHDRIGGLLVYGIPNFKLDKNVVARRVERLAAGGVHFKPKFDVGRDMSLTDLRAQHDAVLIATGVYKARELACPVEAGARVAPALAYLIAANRTGLGDDVPEFRLGALDARGKRVVVIGGGDTAMDCVRTAVRQGATSVSCLYRRDRENMPGSAREVRHAEEEGVAFEWLATPKAISTSGVRAVRMRLSGRDESGRARPVEDESAAFDLPADLVILALGFDPEDAPRLFGAPDLAVTQRGTIRVDRESYETRIPGVYAAGDIVRGASLVVWAIRDGRAAAEAMLKRVAAPVRLRAAAE
ncbi:MAG: NAD(P)-dependent oxidoreductase [Parvularculaceae bacterium]|nr:NAD(P)-dependent oxidoreductase [Parvularculaceae bacterium]